MEPLFFFIQIHFLFLILGSENDFCFVFTVPYVTGIGGLQFLDSMIIKTISCKKNSKQKYWFSYSIVIMRDEQEICFFVR